MSIIIDFECELMLIVDVVEVLLEIIVIWLLLKCCFALEMVMVLALFGKMLFGKMMTTQ